MDRPARLLLVISSVALAMSCVVDFGCDNRTTPIVVPADAGPGPDGGFDPGCGPGPDGGGLGFDGGDPDGGGFDPDGGGARFFDPTRFDRSCEQDTDCVVLESMQTPVNGDEHLCASGCCSAPAIRSTPEVWQSYWAVASTCTSTLVCTMWCEAAARCVAGQCERVGLRPDPDAGPGQVDGGPAILPDGGSWNADAGADPDGG